MNEFSVGQTVKIVGWPRYLEDFESTRYVLGSWGVVESVPFSDQIFVRSNRDEVLWYLPESLQSVWDAAIEEALNDPSI